MKNINVYIKHLTLLQHELEWQMKVNVNVICLTKTTRQLHGELTFYINFYYSIFQFMEKRITLRIFVNKNTILYNNGMKL